MLTDILDGISIKLNNTFGDDYTIYTDNDVVQNLKTPCFFIAILNSVRTQMLKSRYLHRYIFDIHYFPQNLGNNIEIYEISDKLFFTLDIITLPNNDQLKGRIMSCEVIDSILHFKVEYSLFLTERPVSNIIMEDLKIERMNILKC